jgi:type I restriction enzyme M protein
MAKKKKASKKKTTKAKKELTPTERLKQFETELWKAACKLWTNTKLKPSDYKIPVLALIFLRFADQKFEKVAKELEGQSSRRRDPGPNDYKAKGCVYLAPEARWDYLKSLPEGENVGAKVNAAMDLIMEHNEDLKGVLPKTFNRFRSDVLLDLMRVFNPSEGLEGDTFGRIYEFFMSEFEKDSGQKGGEFFTPPSLVHLITEIIEPYHGKIYDPACGSGGMFVSSAKFVEAHKKRPTEELAAFGQERIAETIRIAKMNLAINGFSGSIKDANSYYQDEHNATGKFDFVMANPPFNAKGVDYDRLKDDKKRFPYGMPASDNANYLWIQMFYSALNSLGRAGFVMANSASDAGHSEQKIRKEMIEAGAVDVMVSISPNFFYTVTLPCSLWFFDKGKPEERKDKILFIDARNTFTQVTRAVREYSTEQLEFIANIARLYRGEKTEFSCENSLFEAAFPEGNYQDVKGLCKVATIEEVENQGWSLNPGRYVGAEDNQLSEKDFSERMVELKVEFSELSAKGDELTRSIKASLDKFQL